MSFLDLTNDIDRKFGLAHHSRQMANAVHRTTGCDGHRNSIAERAGGQNVPRSDVLRDQIDDRMASAAGGGIERFGTGADRCAARQRHAQRFREYMHRVGGRQTRTNPRTDDRMTGHRRQIIDRKRAGLQRTDGLVDILDIDMTAVTFAAELIAARNNDRRDIEPRRRHQMRRRRLVARGKQHHAIKLGTFNLHFDVIDEEIAARHQITRLPSRAGDKIGWRNGADLERNTAGFTDSLLDLAAYRIKVSVAD